MHKKALILVLVLSSLVVATSGMLGECRPRPGVPCAGLLFKNLCTSVGLHCQWTGLQSCQTGSSCDTSLSGGFKDADHQNDAEVQSAAEFAAKEVLLSPFWAFAVTWLRDSLSCQRRRPPPPPTAGAADASSPQWQPCPSLPRWTQSWS